MSMSLPTLSGYGNTFVDERKKNLGMRKTDDRNRINCHWMTRFFRAGCGIL